MSQDLFGWLLILAPGALALAFVGAAMVGTLLRERALQRGNLELVASGTASPDDEAETGPSMVARFVDF